MRETDVTGHETRKPIVVVGRHATRHGGDRVPEAGEHASEQPGVETARKQQRVRHPWQDVTTTRCYQRLVQPVGPFGQRHIVVLPAHADGVVWHLYRRLT